jgi:sterol desaturase/sphingolipid hydroxylase (fatty acid hydroxylase superfamily)
MKVGSKPRPRNKLFSILRKEKRDSFKRFPLVFTLLTAFGVVITYNGIHGLIEKVDWLNRNPAIPLVVGILILLFTGTLYKKL